MARLHQRAWTGSLTIFALASGLLLWLFAEEIAAAVHVWNSSSTYGHGYFIFPIVLFLFYRLRHRLAAFRPRPYPLALLPIAGLTLLWIAGDLANVMMVKQFALVGLWQALFLLVLGWRITLAAIFPLAYLLLAVPFGYSIVPTLQDVTAEFVVRLLRLTGMPVFLDGYYIQIPSGNFLVAEACSGVRYLMVCFALGLLVAYLFFRSWKRRLFFIGLSLAVPIVANGIRAYGIVMIAHLSDYRIAVDIDHVVYGFLFLSVVTLVLLGLAAVMRDRYEAPAAPSGPAAPVAAGHGRRLLGQALCALLAVGLVAFGQALAAAATAPPESPATALQAPAPGGDWRALDDAEPPWRPDLHGMDLRLEQSYRNGERRVDLHIAYYDYQREGAEAISDLNTLVGARSAWQQVGAAEIQREIGGRPRDLRRLVLNSRGDRYLVWYWYRVGGRQTASPVLGKFFEMTAVATGGDRSAAIVAIGTEVTEDLRASETLLHDFLNRTLESGSSLVRVER